MLQLANQIYGGAFDSRLVRNIREEKGYTYSPQSQFAAFGDTGVYRAVADVRNEVTGRDAEGDLRRDGRAARRRRRRPPSSTAPRPTRAACSSSRTPRRAGWPRRSTPCNTFGLPADYPETFQARMTALAPEAVVTGARMLLGSADSLVVVVGDYTKVKDQLTGFGDIPIVDVSGKPIAAPQ